MSKTILIVEDEPELLESLTELFEDEGYTVDTAADGRQALAKVDAARHRVVILDLILPFVSGLEVYAAMQADPALCRIPVIISTSDPTRAPPGVLLMKKPIHVERLLEAVQKYC